MRRIALWVGAASIAMAQGGPRVTGRVAMLEKKGKPSPDLGAAVVSLAGEGRGVAAHPVTVEIAIRTPAISATPNAARTAR